MDASSRFGLLPNRNVEAMRAARAVLDISGGDSFTDLYGLWRYRYVIMPKLVAIKARVPLILMPQTYGPFEDEASATAAGEIIRDSRVAWARDERSLAVAKELLASVGAETNDRLKLGVDVAFGLRPTPPAGSPDYRNGAETLAGLNVSGLLWNHPDKAVSQYGFKADYRELILGIARGVLAHPGARLLLIPHVLSDGQSSESDETACEEVYRIIAGEAGGERVGVATDHAAASEAKWVVARCDWFCGTRMHSTIAGLSSGVPTAAIAYSPKTLGVFETCAQGDHVADPRSLDTAEVVAGTLRSFESREHARRSLAEHLPAVIEAASDQMDAIAELCGSLAGG